MQNKTILITGGNDGIGRATAQALALQGATLILACRNQDKGRAAQEAMQKETGNDRIDLIPLDLSDFSNIQEAADLFRKKYQKLDVLINNAAAFTDTLQNTAQGFEMQFGVNHLGHFLLTHLLLEPLRAAPTPRLVNVSSKLHYRGEIDFDNLRGEKGNYSSMAAYAQSKLANLIFAREFARQYPDIVSNALHPGAVATRFANKNTKWYLSLIWSILKLGMVSPEKGAQTSIYLASAPEAGQFTGQYVDDKLQKRRGNPLALDEELAEKLWAYSLEQTEGYFDVV